MDEPDETGTATGVLTPRQFQRFRAALHAYPLVEIAGPLQNREGVVHVQVRTLQPLPLEQALPRSHDYR